MNIARVDRGLHPYRVDSDDERASVGLEGEDGEHDVLCLAADPLAELIEGLEVRLVERVADDLDVHLVQVLLVDAALEEGSWEYETINVRNERFSVSRYFLM